MNKGYLNEKEFVESLNEKYIKDLSKNMQDFIYDIFENINAYDKVVCWKNSANQKADFFIKIGNFVKGVSLKLGHDNSIHGESIQNFKMFLADLDIPYKVIEYYKKYHYGLKINDKKIVGKYTAEEYKKEHLEDLMILNKYLNRTRTIISCVDKFLVRGTNSKYDIAALISGTPEKFVWINKYDLYDLVLSHKNDYTTSPHIGNLIIQPKIRNISGTSKNPGEIHIVQLKWYWIFEDIESFKKQKLLQNMNNLEKKE